MDLQAEGRERALVGAAQHPVGVVDAGEDQVEVLVPGAPDPDVAGHLLALPVRPLLRGHQPERAAVALDAERRDQFGHVRRRVPGNVLVREPVRMTER